MIGLGASSISDRWHGFSQNVKNVEEYRDLVKNDIIPIYRGHILSDEDQLIRRHILNLMCRFHTSWSDLCLHIAQLNGILKKLKEMEVDGLVEITESGLNIPKIGRPYVRNVCMAFDLPLQKKSPKTKLF